MARVGPQHYRKKKVLVIWLQLPDLMRNMYQLIRNEIFDSRTMRWLVL